MLFQTMHANKLKKYQDHKSEAVKTKKTIGSHLNRFTVIKCSQTATSWRY